MVQVATMGCKVVKLMLVLPQRCPPQEPHINLEEYEAAGLLSKRTASTSSRQFAGGRLVGRTYVLHEFDFDPFPCPVVNPLHPGSPMQLSTSQQQVQSNFSALSRSDSSQCLVSASLHGTPHCGQQPSTQAHPLDADPTVVLFV